jgi:hypothetical protein
MNAGNHSDYCYATITADNHCVEPVVPVLLSALHTQITAATAARLLLCHIN